MELPMSTKYRRKTSAVEAMQWTGENTDEVVRWVQGEWKTGGIWLKQRWMGQGIDPIWSLMVPTQYAEEIEMSPGDWLVKPDDNLPSVIKEADFAVRYEPIPEVAS
jgi:hypothetical protein